LCDIDIDRKVHSEYFTLSRTITIKSAFRWSVKLIYLRIVEEEAQMKVSPEDISVTMSFPRKCIITLDEEEILSLLQGCELGKIVDEITGTVVIVRRDDTVSAD